ncbi:HAD family phosphatase [Candidatus Saccharibacteria bacterium]|nr:HAD family phosphatase [Candidatus Saccharibacteria bacterium]
MSRKSVEAIIFDYDGLLVDTENFWFEACRQVCSIYGVQITEEHRLDLMRSGLSAYLVESFFLPDSSDAIHSKIHAVFHQLTGGVIDLMPGVKPALKALDRHYPLAIGTGARTSLVQEDLSRLPLLDYFKVIVGSDQVARGKPEPDIYLRVAELLGTEPSFCVVFEDSPKGVQAAKAAGMLCIAVPNRYLKGIDYSQADRVINNLGQVSLQLLRQL